MACVVVALSVMLLHTTIHLQLEVVPSCTSSYLAAGYNATTLVVEFSYPFR